MEKIPPRVIIEVLGSAGARLIEPSLQTAKPSITVKFQRLAMAKWVAESVCFLER